jgi:Ca-activated chloride channel homolog
MTRHTACLITLLLSLGLVIPIMGEKGQQSAAADSSPQQPLSLKVDVNLVLAPVTVIDGQGRFIVGLEHDNFQLWEDKVEQKILNVSAEDTPISVGVILDMSGSMKDKLGIARDAAATFLRTVLNKDDEFFLISFADRPQVSVDFTTEISRISGSLLAMDAKGSTALYDAVYAGLHKLGDAANGRKVLLLITDGEDNRSRYTFSNIREYVKEQDIQIYAIGIGDPANPQFGAEGAGRDRIQELTELTGGRSFFLNSVSELGDACFKIGIEIKNQYVIAYRSTNTMPDGKWRKLRVSAHLKGTRDLHVRARPGYYGPSATIASGN